MNGNLDKCFECKYFSWRDTVPEKDCKMYWPLDGYCSKIFPRGYVGAGKPGGAVHHSKPACFQFEPAVSEGQMTMEELT